MSDSPIMLRTQRGDAGERVDLILARHPTGLRSVSRTRVQAWIENGQVSINGTTVRRPATRLALHDVITVVVPANAANDGDRAAGGMAAENVPLELVYEDDYLLALNKAPGLVVHPGYKNTTGTLMNALLGYARNWPAPQRPSIVGRLDKLTSGIVLVAKSASAHAVLQRVMASTDAAKDYLAVVYGRVDVAGGQIGFRLRRDPGDRRRVVASGTVGAQSFTRFERLGRVTAAHEGVSLLRCSLITGRMHQIRVHLAACGWPIVGDPVYGEPRWSNVDDTRLATALRTFPRQALHAWRLALTHPVTHARLILEAAVPRDLETLLSATGLCETCVGGSSQAVSSVG
jgi:23S rRNA pseudouridine1911/1915/1917 synthase